MYDHLVIVVTRDEVESSDLSGPLKTLKTILSSAESIRTHRTRLDIAFHGYDDTTVELFEMPEVRDFVRALDTEFPFWLYFMTRHSSGLRSIMLCFLLPHLTEKAQRKRHPAQLVELLENRWGPALNHVCQFAGETESQADELLNSSIEYFNQGPHKS